MVDDVLIIILNWNGAEETIECLKSLNKQTYKNYNILLIDNGSSDNSVKIIKESQKTNKKIITLFNKNNIGFAGGVNVGIKYAIDKDFKYIVLINNDAVASKDWLEELVSCAHTAEASIITSCLLKKDKNIIDSTGDWYSIWGLPFPRGRDKAINNSYKSGYIFGASGGASLYDLDIFKNIGLFDEKFFAYYEDVDVSFRAQLAGYKVYFCKTAVVYHDHGTSSNKISGFTTYQTFKNLPILFIKNVPKKLLWTIGTHFFVAYSLIFWHAIFKGNTKSAIKGFIKSVSLIPYALHERHFIQSRLKKVDDNYIKNIIWNDLPPDQTGIRKLKSFFKIG